MSRIPAPGTAWEEKVAPDEAERFAHYAQLFTRIQKTRRQSLGPGRAVHRKQLAAAHGTLEVLDSLPDFARHGLFARPHDYKVLVRLSNGSSNRMADTFPDVRGFAIRVLGVEGPSALGDGSATSQDFTLINQESFLFADSGEFVAFVVAASHGFAALFWHFFKGTSVADRACKRLPESQYFCGRRWQWNNVPSAIATTGHCGIVLRLLVSSLARRVTTPDRPTTTDDPTTDDRPDDRPQVRLVRAGRIRRSALENRVRKALSREHLASFVVVEIGGDDNAPTLRWRVDQTLRDTLERTRLGRRVLCTDRHTWSAERIVHAFRGQWNVEELRHPSEGAWKRNSPRISAIGAWHTARNSGPAWAYRRPPWVGIGGVPNRSGAGRRRRSCTRSSAIMSRRFMAPLMTGRST